jgi:hypothetical protein
LLTSQRKHPRREITMENGHYKVEFQTPLGVGAGVVFYQNGAVHGGDSMMAYMGALRRTER